MGRSRKPAQPAQPRFPTDMLQRLERLGRHALDPMGCGLDDVHTAGILPFVEYIEANEAEQESFLRDLHALVATDQGGFATYGAARLAWELFSEKVLQMPAALPLVDAGIEFKLARGQPPNWILTGYELKRFGVWFDQRNEPASFDSRRYFQWLTQPRDTAG